VVLELLSASASHEASAAGLVEAGALLGVGESNVRVTLARLVASGTLEVGGRGVYRLGKASQALTRQVTSWRDLERLVRRWDGGWVFVHEGGRATDRSAARRSARALMLLGFRPLARGLEARPDNLEGGAGALRERLVALGLPSSSIVFRATDLDSATDARARSLWDAEKLSASYVHTRERIERWLVAAADLDPRAAAREAFFFGSDVLRQILFDPRLPDPLVDVAARRAMVDAAKKLDAYGRRLWGRLFGMPHGLSIDAKGESVPVLLARGPIEEGEHGRPQLS
jgi:phenylacetic acid degradation operon negative regulatory protein